MQNKFFPLADVSFQATVDIFLLTKYFKFLAVRYSQWKMVGNL